jgi:glutaredoxin
MLQVKIFFRMDCPHSRAFISNVFDPVEKSFKKQERKDVKFTKIELKMYANYEEKEAWKRKHASQDGKKIPSFPTIRFIDISATQEDGGVDLSQWEGGMRSTADEFKTKIENARMQIDTGSSDLRGQRKMSSREMKWQVRRI